MGSPSRLDQLLTTLKAFYGPLPWPPHDPFTLFVWEVLSYHAAPRKRDAALEALRRSRALTPDAMWRAPRQKLQEAIVLAGPYAEQRLLALGSGVDVFRRAPSLPAIITGPITGARRALKRLPQMGEGGAYRMLLFAAGHPVLPVDASLSRVARRLGYGEEHAQFANTARSIRAAAARELTPAVASYRRAYLYLAHHGLATCTEADPHCRVCPLLDECAEGQERRRLGVT
jgi:endonuclease-3